MKEEQDKEEDRMRDTSPRASSQAATSPKADTRSNESKIYRTKKSKMPQGKR